MQVAVFMARNLAANARESKRSGGRKMNGLETGGSARQKTRP
jgi:hypothetical protein